MLDTDITLRGISDCVKYKEHLYLLYHAYLFSECPIIRLRDVPMWCPGTSLYDVRQFCCFFVVIPCWWHCPIYPVYHVLTLCPYMMIMKKNISGLPQRRSGDVHIWGPGTFQQKVRQSFFLCPGLASTFSLVRAMSVDHSYRFLKMLTILENFTILYTCDKVGKILKFRRNSEM